MTGFALGAGALSRRSPGVPAGPGHQRVVKPVVKRKHSGDAEYRGEHGAVNSPKGLLLNAGRTTQLLTEG